jgi:putative ABC transport system permease protein
VAQWFWADTRQQLPGLSLALMALLAGDGGECRRGTMVSSFRLTFTGFLDQRLASELYVSARMPNRPAAIWRWPTPHADAVLPILERRPPVAGLPAEIYGAATTPPIATTGRSSRAVPDVWDALARARACWSTNSSRAAPGCRSGRPGRPAPGGGACRCGASMATTATRSAQVIVTEALFRARFPTPSAALRPAGAPDEVDALRAALRRRGLPEGAMIDQAAIKALLAVGVRADLHRHRRAERPDAGRRGLRDPDEPADAGRDAPAATGPGLGAGADAGRLAGWSCCARWCWPR